MSIKERLRLVAQHSTGTAIDTSSHSGCVCIVYHLQPGMGSNLMGYRHREEETSEVLFTLFTIKTFRRISILEATVTMLTVQQHVGNEQEGLSASRSRMHSSDQRSVFSTERSVLGVKPPDRETISHQNNIKK